MYLLHVRLRGVGFAPNGLAAWSDGKSSSGTSAWDRGVAGGVNGPDMFGVVPVNLWPVPPSRGRAERPEEAPAGLP